MALIIKGKMPKSCSSCKSVQRYRYSDECEYLRKPIARNGRLKDCPIIGEIPDEHGDLVDRDKLREKVEKYAFVPEQTYTEYMMKVEKAITDAPVILEASIRG